MGHDVEIVAHELACYVIKLGPDASPRELAEAAWLLSRWFTPPGGEDGPNEDESRTAPSSLSGTPPTPRPPTKAPGTGEDVVPDPDGQSGFEALPFKVLRPPVLPDRLAHSRGLSRCAVRTPTRAHPVLDLADSIRKSSEYGRKTVVFKPGFVPARTLVFIHDTASALDPWKADAEALRALSHFARGYVSVVDFEVDLSEEKPALADSLSTLSGRAVTCLVFTDGLGAGFGSLAAALEGLGRHGRVAWMHPWPGHAWRRTPVGQLRRTVPEGPRRGAGVPMLVIPFDTTARRDGVGGWEALASWVRGGRPRGWPTVRLLPTSKPPRPREAQWDVTLQALQNSISANSLRLLGLAAALPVKSLSVDLLRALALASRMHADAFRVAEVLTSGFLKREGPGAFSFKSQEAARAAIQGFQAADLRDARAALLEVGAKAGIEASVLERALNGLETGRLWKDYEGDEGDVATGSPLHFTTAAALSERLDKGLPCLLRMPRGAGKTHIAFEIARRHLERSDAHRVLWVARDEASSQQTNKDLRNWDLAIGMTARMLNDVGLREGRVFFTSAGTLGAPARNLLANAGVKPTLVVFEDLADARGSNARPAQLNFARGLGAPVLYTTTRAVDAPDFPVDCYRHDVSAQDLVKANFWHPPSILPFPTATQWAPRSDDSGDIAQAQLEEIAVLPARNSAIRSLYNAESARFGKTLVHACGPRHAETLRDTLAATTGLRPVWLQDPKRAGVAVAEPDTTLWISSDPDEDVRIEGLRTVILARPTMDADRFLCMALQALRAPDGMVVSLQDDVQGGHVRTHDDLCALGSVVLPPQRVGLQTGTDLARFVLEEPIGASGLASTWWVRKKSRRLTVVDATVSEASMARARKAWAVFAQPAPRPFANLARSRPVLEFIEWPPPSLARIGLAWPAMPALFEPLRDGQGEGLPWQACLRLAGELLDVLVVLHAQGVAHRDIRRDNVFEVRDRDGVSSFYLGPPGVGLSRAESADPPPEVRHLRNRYVHSQHGTVLELEDRAHDGLPADIWMLGRLVANLMELQGGHGSTLAAEITSAWCADDPAKRPTAVQAREWLGQQGLGEPRDPPWPKYIDPVTSEPWYTCPNCKSTHTRGVIVGLQEEMAIGTLKRRTEQSEGWNLEDACFEFDSFKRSEGGLLPSDVLLTLLECGPCKTTWRPDGAALGQNDWSRGLGEAWDVIHTKHAEAEPLLRLVEGLGVTVRDGRETGLGDVGLSAEDIGHGVSFMVENLEAHTTFWFDEPCEDGSTGLHLHPQNVLERRSPAYMARFAQFSAEEEWYESLWEVMPLATRFVHVDSTLDDQAPARSRALLAALKAGDLRSADWRSSSPEVLQRAWTRLVLHATRSGLSRADCERWRALLVPDRPAGPPAKVAPRAQVLLTALRAGDLSPEDWRASLPDRAQRVWTRLSLHGIRAGLAKSELLLWRSDLIEQRVLQQRDTQ